MDPTALRSAPTPKAPRLWCAVSGHGFGHWGQLAPILNQIVGLLPECAIHITGNLPSQLIERTLHHPFSHDPINRDVALVQLDPMNADLPATRAALNTLHRDWPARIAEEARRMAEWRPDLILGNIPYLPIEAAAQLGIPTVAVTSLTWDQVVAAYFPPGDAEIAGWIHTMRQAYRRATLALRATPALPEHPFAEAIDIPPITTSGINRRAELRWMLQIDRQDTRPLVLITLGGIQGNQLPVAVLKAQRDFHWLIDRPFEHSDHACHLHPVNSLKKWPFADLIASADAIVSKPGYGMAIGAAAHSIPFLYVRRGTFPDEEPILSWCASHNRIAEIDTDAFQNGRFTAPLFTLLQRPAPPVPAVDGAEVAAKILLESSLS
ncbi:MAG: hypothetical protein H7834_07130 [Magnetococcus sp. YQC-9]